jgi:mono/diheme cytochrome c family protein
MRILIVAAGGAVLGLALAAAAALAYVRASGLESRSAPGPLERRVARIAREWALSAEARNRRSPAAATPETIKEGMTHFADHCASCHANDGSGNTEMGRGLHPKAPDMRLPATQQLSDGELFWVIENGIRFTGMPAWSTGTAAGEASSWHLVQFIRHLPALAPDEIDTMKRLNPRSPEDVRQEIAEEQFLNEGAQQ